MFKMLWSNEEITDDSKYMFKKNKQIKLDRCLNRSGESFLNDCYGCLKLLCCAEFLHYYYLAVKPQNNGCQPVELSDDLHEKNFLNEIYPSIKLKFSNKSKCQ